ncbi:MAG: hypothetical protein ACT4OT_11540 [Acidobacteriota bacterium]
MTKEKISYLLSHRFRRRSGDTRELAERLAPLEELAPAESKKPPDRVGNSQVVAQEEGAIVVGRNKPALPQDVIDRSDRNGIFGIEPVVIVIVGLLLAFIMFIAWQISRMPAE